MFSISIILNQSGFPSQDYHSIEDRFFAMISTKSKLQAKLYLKTLDHVHEAYSRYNDVIRIEPKAEVDPPNIWLKKKKGMVEVWSITRDTIFKCPEARQTKYYQYMDFMVNTYGRADENTINQILLSKQIQENMANQNESNDSKDSNKLKSKKQKKKSTLDHNKSNDSETIETNDSKAIETKESEAIETKDSETKQSNSTYQEIKQTDDALKNDPLEEHRRYKQNNLDNDPNNCIHKSYPFINPYDSSQCIGDYYYPYHVNGYYQYFDTPQEIYNNDPSYFDDGYSPQYYYDASGCLVSYHTI